MEDQHASRQDSRTINTYIATALKESQSRISLADGKANILLGIVGLLFSLFLKEMMAHTEYIVIAVVLVMIPLITSGFFALATVLPRVKPPKQKTQSILFFENARTLDMNAFAKKLNRMPEEEIYADYLQNIQALGAIISKKFRYLRWGYIFLAVGFIGKVIFEVIVLT